MRQFSGYQTRESCWSPNPGQHRSILRIRIKLLFWRISKSRKLLKTSLKMEKDSTGKKIIIIIKNGGNITDN